MALTDYMCQEKKEEQDSPALNIVSMHQFEDSKTTGKRAKKLITVTRNSTGNRTKVTWKQK